MPEGVIRDLVGHVDPAMWGTLESVLQLENFAGIFFALKPNILQGGYSGRSHTP